MLLWLGQQKNLNSEIHLGLIFHLLRGNRINSANSFRSTSDISRPSSIQAASPDEIALKFVWGKLSRICCSTPLASKSLNRVKHKSKRLLPIKLGVIRDAELCNDLQEALQLLKQNQKK